MGLRIDNEFTFDVDQLSKNTLRVSVSRLFPTGCGPSSTGTAGALINVEDQQVMKRSHGEGDEVMDVGVGEIIGDSIDSIVDVNGDDMTCDEGDLKQGSGASSKPTSRDMLMGHSIGAQPAPSIPDLDVDIQEEDVQISTID
ncbi:hypothetical protein V6N13_005891 [Hibiscus sabdariffa]|uniref:Uncharacterized protein n=1 Tax=Hibiscus sabdariffa TaxID=183260 RepID=A0ABR2EPE7_9ROSI